MCWWGWVAPSSRAICLADRSMPRPCWRSWHASGPSAAATPEELLAPPIRLSRRVAARLLRRLIRQVGIDKTTGLAVPQARIEAAGLQQLGMGAHFHDTSLIEHHQPIHHGDGG